MPTKTTVEKAKKALAEGKAPTTAAGEMVREEMHRSRQGRGAAQSRKQAIAIGLSKARRAGVPVKSPQSKSRSSSEKAGAKEQQKTKGEQSSQSRGRKRSASTSRRRQASTTAGRQARASGSRAETARRARQSAARKRTRTGARAAAGRAASSNAAAAKSTNGHKKTMNGHTNGSTRTSRSSRSQSVATDIFASNDPKEIARALKRSLDHREHGKTEPFRSAMSMLTLFINRAGNSLTDRRKRTLEKAKDELREVYHRQPS